MDNDLKYWNAINKIDQIGPARFKRLYNYFSSMEEAWQAIPSQLREAGIEENVIEIFIEQRGKIDPDQELEKVKNEHINLITVKDEKYPKLLKEIYDPPALLYIRGQFAKQDEFAVAIVGTRKVSNYGKQVTPQIAQDLAGAKVTIVSGMAQGVDSLAHEATLASGGRTIAVLGGGIDQKSVYPPSNRKLAQEIIESGAVISEYPITTEPLAQHFPVRNRIISGISLGTLVIEAGEESGALITARSSLEQNRQVFAIPGSVFSENSLGPNNLIKMGAKLITSSQDILDELNLNLAIEYVKAQKIIPDTKEEALLLEHLSREPLHIDRLVEQTGLDTAKASSTLTMMEMKGKVKNLGAMMYVVTR